MHSEFIIVGRCTPGLALLAIRLHVVGLRLRHLHDLVSGRATGIGFFRFFFFVGKHHVFGCGEFLLRLLNLLLLGRHERQELLVHLLVHAHVDIRVHLRVL